MRYLKPTTIYKIASTILQKKNDQVDVNFYTKEYKRIIRTVLHHMENEIVSVCEEDRRRITLPEKFPNKIKLYDVCFYTVKSIYKNYEPAPKTTKAKNPATTAAAAATAKRKRKNNNYLRRERKKADRRRRRSSSLEEEKTSITSTSSESSSCECEEENDDESSESVNDDDDDDEDDDDSEDPWKVVFQRMARDEVETRKAFSEFM